MTDEFDVICEQCLFEDNSTGVTAKMSSAIAEVNVWFTVAEAQHVRQILDIAIDAHGLQLGRSVDSNVYWTRDTEDRFYLLIGHDDTTWDIGFTLPISTVRTLVQCVVAACGRDKC
jgi:hypothetical protein